MMKNVIAVKNSALCFGLTHRGAEFHTENVI